MQAVAVRGMAVFHNLVDAEWGLEVAGGAGLYAAGERRA